MPVWVFLWWNVVDELAPSHSVVTSNLSVLHVYRAEIQVYNRTAPSEAQSHMKKNEWLPWIRNLFSAGGNQSMYWQNPSSLLHVLSKWKCKCITELRTYIIQWPSVQATRLKDENNKLGGVNCEGDKTVRWGRFPPKHIKTKLQCCHGSSWKHTAFPIAIGPWISKLWCETNYIL